MNATITYDFTVTLLSSWYDESEQEQETRHGRVRRHTGTEESVEAFARRTRTQATSARIERVAVHDGPRFRAHEVKTFTIGL